MKVLFAVSNEGVSNSIVKEYSRIYKEIISGKNVYYFNAILKELQKDKSYDRIVISEDLEPFTNNNFDTIDNFLFDKLDSISDEATNNTGDDIPIILIATDRRGKSDSILIKLFGIGVYSAIIGQDRSIENVCKLINKPRTKKEAKVYYQIESGEVEYKAESQSDVSELEIQNIINHYKRLGKNEDRYVESFDSIASQYTDAQLKIIIKFLPLNVKAVLEANSQRYQQLMSFGTKTKNMGYTVPKTNQRKEDKSGIKVESILEKDNKKKMSKPVIIPGTVSTKNVKKVPKDNSISKELDAAKNEIKPEVFKEPIQEEKVEAIIEKPQIIKEEIQEQVQEPKKRRGRPRKVQAEVIEPEIEDKEEVIIEEPQIIKEEPLEQVQEPKKRRGRPRKVQTEVSEPVTQEKENVNLFSIDEDDNKEDDEEETTLPGFEELDFDEKEDNEEETTLPGFEELDFDNEENTLPGIEEDNEEDNEEENNINTLSNRNIQSSNSQNTQPNNKRRSLYDELIPNPINTFTQTSENLLTKDKKVVAFVGTSKNGTSFLVNNLAELLSSQGIRTAILDLTKNKNSYYIYTKNEEELRKISFECMEKLTQSKAEGIRVNKSLDVYTCLPGEENYIGKSESIMQTLLSNYSLVLMDCDFDSEYEYMNKAQEIYLVQSMDILTIQPLTAYLRNLKAKNLLTEGKLRVVINKDLKLRGVTEKAIIGGMSCYNDPAMSFMTELFNRETIRYAVIPFDIGAYSKYLEGLVNCMISLNGYSKEFIVALKKLSSMVYPMINGKDKFNNYNRF